jgi:hypothetical protein
VAIGDHPHRAIDSQQFVPAVFDFDAQSGVARLSWPVNHPDAWAWVIRKRHVLGRPAPLQTAHAARRGGGLSCGEGLTHLTPRPREGPQDPKPFSNKCHSGRGLVLLPVNAAHPGRNHTKETKR